MIRIDKEESFPITVSLIDDGTGYNVPGQLVYYDIRDTDDIPLLPPASGILTESSVEPGIYRITENINNSGTYIIYATCSGFPTNTEEVIVNQESIYDITKQYNTYAEDVSRVNAIPTGSQITRKVPFGKTDFIINKIKKSSDSDWSGATISGSVWAWYKNITDDLPFRMGAEF